MTSCAANTGVPAGTALPPHRRPRRPSGLPPAATSGRTGPQDRRLLWLCPRPRPPAERRPNDPPETLPQGQNRGPANEGAGKYATDLIPYGCPWIPPIIYMLSSDLYPAGPSCRRPLSSGRPRWTTGIATHAEPASHRRGCAPRTASPARSARSPASTSRSGSARGLACHSLVRRRLPATAMQAVDGLGVAEVGPAEALGERAA